jgi:molecular chaperone GrpE (heat shock protein)
VGLSAPERQLGMATNEDGAETEGGAETEVTPVPAENADDSPPLGELVGRLDQIEQHLAEFHQRAAHREAVIDLLHEENQKLRTGIGRLILAPVTADLIRLYGQLAQEARRLDTAGQDGRLVRSFADDVEQILDRCGIEVFSAQPGDPFDSGRHRAVGVVACEDESQHNTVAEVVAAGFCERDTGRVTRPVQARFRQFAPAAQDRQPDAAQPQ